jgi:hypothetical protein
MDDSCRVGISHYLLELYKDGHLFESMTTAGENEARERKSYLEGLGYTVTLYEVTKSGHRTHIPH